MILLIKKYKGISWASPPPSWFRMESGSMRSGPSDLTRFSSFMEVRKAVFSTNSSSTVSVVETALLHKTPLVVTGDTLLHTSAINHSAQPEIIATSVPSSPLQWKWRITRWILHPFPLGLRGRTDSS
jgi:hypothetical protein